MDTNMVYGIIAVVVIAVLLIVGGIWMDRSRKKNIQQSQEAAKAKADERLAAERAAQRPTAPEPAEAKRSPAEQTPDALAPGRRYRCRVFPVGFFGTEGAPLEWSFAVRADYPIRNDAPNALPE